jgi:pyruvate dehydrogenase E2 component (dihydrolipoamide acetyltransferase)
MPKFIPVTGIRKIIAERMLESWHTSPVVLYAASVDTTNMTNFRAKFQAETNRKISVNVVFAKVCAKALKEYSYVNASFIDNNIVLHENINVGFAVSIENGIIVPNTKNCDQKSMAEVAEDLDKLFTAARTNKLKYEDIMDGTFTITNMGVIKDIEFHMPIINQPELAILGVYAPKDTPVVVNKQIVIRPMMKLCLVADHRVIDGSLAGQFLGRIKELLENPELI